MKKGTVMKIHAAITSFSGRYRFLSNFHPLHRITTEHIYQAMKTEDWREQVRVLSAPTPGAAKRRGRKVTLREDWDEIRLDVMEECLTRKFQDDELRQQLLATGDKPLVEGNTWGDTFWGMCAGKGRNHLGNLLMKLRNEIRG